MDRIRIRYLSCERECNNVCQQCSCSASSSGYQKSHSRCDNGSQYRSKAFRESMRDLGINKLEFIYYNTPEQNGHIESFHKTLKKEYLWPQDFRNYQEAEIRDSWRIQGLQPEQDSFCAWIHNAIRIPPELEISNRQDKSIKSVCGKSMNLQMQKTYRKWRGHSNT